MGRIEVGSAIRYVSPVTARLFSKTGPEVLGLAGKVLVPVEEGPPAWRRQPPSEKAQHQRRKQMQRARRTTRPKAYGEAAQRSMEFVVPSPPSPTTDDDAELISPQMCFEAILRERGYDSTPRSSASEGCRCEPTQKQIKDYQIPLVEAVRRGDLHALEALAASGVDMGASNRFGESIVHLATRRGSVAVLQFLLSHSASLRICDDYGKTPMHDAFWTAEPRVDVVSMMISIDWRLLRATDVRGATPLRYAKKRHWRMWCTFLDQVKDQYWPHLPPGEREIGACGSRVEAGQQPPVL